MRFSFDACEALRYTAKERVDDYVERFGERMVPVGDAFGGHLVLIVSEKGHDKSAYIQHLLGYIDPQALRPLRIVVNAGNGGAGRVVDLLAENLPLEFIRINHEPDGSFPNGIPNPLLVENRAATAAAVREHQADFGIALGWRF